MLVPLLMPAAPAVADLVGARRRVGPAAGGTLWILLVATTGVYVALDLTGVHLLAMRYLLPLALPAALVSGLVLARTRTVPAILLWTVVLALTVAQASVVRAASGLPNLRPNQDWRRAVAVLQLELDDHPGAPVLYRSGFVEDDRSDGARSSFVNSPLRSPGRAPLVANLVPLTWSWSAATERRLESTVRAAVEEATVFYVLSCDCDTRATGPYVAMLREWIDRQFGERFAATELDGGRNIVLIRFEAPAQSVSEP